MSVICPLNYIILCLDNPLTGEGLSAVRWLFVRQGDILLRFEPTCPDTLLTRDRRWLGGVDVECHTLVVRSTSCNFLSHFESNFQTEGRWEGEERLERIKTEV